VGTTSVQNAEPQSPPMTKKFAALCVNTGEFNKTLGEIEVSSINTDRQVFHKFKEKYQNSVDFGPVLLDGFSLNLWISSLFRFVDETKITFSLVY